MRKSSALAVEQPRICEHRIHPITEGDITACRGAPRVCERGPFPDERSRTRGRLVFSPAHMRICSQHKSCYFAVNVSCTTLFSGIFAKQRPLRSNACPVNGNRQNAAQAGDEQAYRAVHAKAENRIEDLRQNVAKSPDARKVRQRRGGSRMPLRAPSARQGRSVREPEQIIGGHVEKGSQLEYGGGGGLLLPRFPIAYACI